MLSDIQLFLDWEEFKNLLYSDTEAEGLKQSTAKEAPKCEPTFKRQLKLYRTLLEMITN